ncbi:ribosomal protein L7/L12 [Inconstantimicrobium mannanitabidum]|uniref:Uncharacterized protein n=1 Tax=Inconstantimicrobium mannanitabidum TaxID=1604901 RepID=A0ACB5R9P8_9CLOT|nr:ribosomal protein L7/L12 [Clostridium sp. TW13]GKX65913.1 hypothetical protein rsdtw13_11710 [Clostridium sp. TW13]
MNSNVMMIIIGVSILIILVSIISQLRNDMMRMKITLDKIAKKVGVPDIITKEVKDELLTLISEGKKIQAIKTYRMLTGIGLKEAKEYIDEISIDVNDK